MRVDSVGVDLDSLEGFPVEDISGTVLVDQDPGHHEVRYDDGDNQRVIFLDGVDPLEVPIRESDRRETSVQGCVDKVNVDVPDGVQITFSRLVGLFPK